ncbi:WD40 repeat-like protein [Suillus weaverae]|nr:WD40 repeat-like protein [Suillus weaverae]
MTLKGHKRLVSDIAFIRGTRLLVTGSTDRSLRVWDLDTGKQVGEPLLDHNTLVLRVAASPDGRWIVSGGVNGSILVWEVATDKTDLKRVPISFEGHKGSIYGVVFAPDSETFAKDQTVCVWKRETGKIVLGPFNVGSWACSVSYSPDGKKLAAGTAKHIIVWNTKTGEELLKIEQEAFGIAFTPDGLRLVSTNGRYVRFSDATTGDIIKQFHPHTFTSFAIAPNGTKFATTSLDNTTRFFDLTTFEPIGEPLEHPQFVLGLAFSEDNQLIATGCSDSLVRTWTVPLSESEKESTQKILKKTIPGIQPRPRRAPIQTMQEDIAYSLFGIFGVHLPVMYGEKKQNALGRLLQEVVARSGDISALDWVGQSSEFNSCLPASITSYTAPPYTPPFLSEGDIQTSISLLRQDVAVDLALKFYALLDNLNAPRFANCRLQLHCIAFRVTAVTQRPIEHKGIFTYEVKAHGLRDLQITTEDLLQFSRGRRARQSFLLVRPWDRRLLELPYYADDTESVDDFTPPGSPGAEGPVDPESIERAMRLIVRLGQPFSAFLLAQQPNGEYKRIASDRDIITQVKDVDYVHGRNVRTLEIL